MSDLDLQYKETLQKFDIRETLENLVVGKRWTKKKLEDYLTKKFGVVQTLDDVSKDDDELGDWNLLGNIDRTYDGVHIYAYYDIYFLKMKQEGFDGNDIYVTEVGIEFE